MNEWIAEIGMFLVQTTIVMTLLGIGLLLIARTKQDNKSDLKLTIEPLNDQRRRRGRRLRLAATLPGARKKLLKTFRHEDKNVIRPLRGNKRRLKSHGYGCWIFMVT